jgi:ribosomal protein S12 methylthiotransferase accessory factor
MLDAFGTEDAPKSYRLGTHRLVAPSATLARIRPLMPVMGITRIANVTGLDRIGLPVVMVCRPNSRSIAVSQGKGLDLYSAKVSGVMEAVETYHGETIQSPLKLGSLEELRYNHPMIDVSGLPSQGSGRFHDQRQILWIEGMDLVTETPVWIPYEAVHTNYTLPLPAGSGCFVANTNGLASGNHLFEAISHGICEVIERDAVTLWKLRGEEERRGSAIDLDTVDDDACRSLLRQLEAADIDVKVWDTTSDVGVACFQCLLVGRQDRYADPEFGSGCHPAREVALLRAVSEAAQARTTYISGARDDFLPRLYEPTTRARRLGDCRALLEAHPPVRHFHEAPTWHAETFAQDVAEEVKRLRSAGIRQVAVVDLTKPAFRLPVVRVVIPGLEAALEEDKGDYLPGPRAMALLDDGA